MLNIIVEQITSLGDGVLMIGSLAYILGVRKGKSKYLVLFMLLQYLCAQYLIQLPVQQFILGIAVNIGMCYVCLKESWRSWCLWSIIIMILYIVSSSVCFPVISLVTGEPMSVLITGNIFTRICSILIARLLLVILIWAAMIQRKNRVYLKWRQWVLSLLILIAAAFILISLLEINLNTGIYGKEQGHILGIFTLQLVILGCCTFLALHISKMNQRMNEGKIVAIQLDKQKAMIEKAYQMQRETRILSHDLKHYAMAWTKLLEEGNVEQAKKQMAGFTGAVSSIGVNVYYIVDNEMLNAVMYEKAQLCRKKDIFVRWQITTSYPKEREMDMAIVFSNLMDNAIRAEENLPEAKRFIGVDCFEVNNIRHFIVSNYIEESVLDRNPQLHTTKEDAENHGLGILSVKKVVNQYGGLIDISEENSRFMAHIACV